MKEDILQYIWKFQYYNFSDLLSSDGESIEMIHPGIHNVNQGPDFTEAKIKINDTVWIGNVEIHVNASDWNLHHHSEDDNYKNIILHVVWNNDVLIKDNFRNDLPTLELQGRISKLLLDKYKQLMGAPSFIPCENLDNGLSDLAMNSWKQRLVAERLINKSGFFKTSIFAYSSSTPIASL